MKRKNGEPKKVGGRAAKTIPHEKPAPVYEKRVAPQEVIPFDDDDLEEF